MIRCPVVRQDGPSYQLVVLGPTAADGLLPGGDASEERAIERLRCQEPVPSIFRVREFAARPSRPRRRTGDGVQLVAQRTHAVQNVDGVVALVAGEHLA